MHALLLFALGAFFGGLAVHELSKLHACTKRREADKAKETMARA